MFQESLTTPYLKDRDEDDIKPVMSKHASIFNDEDEDSNEPSILEMAKLPERSTTPDILQPPEPETAPQPGSCDGRLFI